MKKNLLLLIFLVFLSGCGVKEAPAAEDDGWVVIALLDTGISTTAIDPSRILPGYNYVLVL